MDMYDVMKKHELQVRLSVYESLGHGGLEKPLATEGHAAWQADIFLTKTITVTITYSDFLPKSQKRKIHDQSFYLCRTI